MKEIFCHNCEETFWIDDSREQTKDKYGCPYCQCQNKKLLQEMM